jgi:phytoene synthase
MNFETERALGFYAAAVAALPPPDRFSMTAAEIMRNIYHRLLLKMRAGGFRIFNRRYSLSRLEKAFVIIRTMLLSRFF